MADNGETKLRVAPSLDGLTRLPRQLVAGRTLIRDVLDHDGAVAAGHKALFMASAAASTGRAAMVRRELQRAAACGVTTDEAMTAAGIVLTSRGEDAFADIVDAIDAVFAQPPDLTTSTDGATSMEDPSGYFARYFGTVPAYIEVMAEHAPSALEGYALMREVATARNALGAVSSELLLCTINATTFSTGFVEIHARAARRAGASIAQVVEAVLCSIPVGGVPTWITAADAIVAAFADGTS